MRFGVSPELKEAFLQTMWRIGKVLKIKTQEQVLEFINSVFVDMDEEMIKAQAGEQSAPKQNRP